MYQFRPLRLRGLSHADKLITDSSRRSGTSHQRQVNTKEPGHDDMTLGPLDVSYWSSSSGCSPGQRDSKDSTRRS